MHIKAATCTSHIASIQKKMMMAPRLTLYYT